MSTEIFEDKEKNCCYFTIHSKTHGEYSFLIDKKDKLEVEKHTWSVYKSPNGKQHIYAYTTFSRPKTGEYGRVQLHQFIMFGNKTTGVMKKRNIDHINQDTTDNRRSNLRWASHRENGFNRGVQKNNTTGYKGVSTLKRGKLKYYVKAKINGKCISRGMFCSPEEAALAYDSLIKENHAEFGWLNFPNGPSDEVLKTIKETNQRYEDFINKNKASKYIGVTYWCKIEEAKNYKRPWRANLIYNKKRYTVAGTYATDEEAAIARDKQILINKLPIPTQVVHKLMEE